MVEMIVTFVVVVGPKEIADFKNGFVRCDVVAIVEWQKLVVIVNGNIILDDDWIVGVVT